MYGWNGPPAPASAWQTRSGTGMESSNWSKGCWNMRSRSEKTPQMNISLRISSSPVGDELFHQQAAPHGGEHHRPRLTSLLDVASRSASQRLRRW